MSDKELMKQARKIATDDLLIKHVVYVMLSDKRLEKIIKLVRQHSPTGEEHDKQVIAEYREAIVAAVGGKCVYAPQGADFEHQARCEQINAGISMAIAAIRELEKK
jgi:hypothetical protein